MHAIVRDWRAAGLSPVDQALCAFAVKLTLDQQRMSAEDIETLRCHGLPDTAIHDAAQVIALFNNLARIADGLGVEPEDFIEPWGRPLSAAGGP